MLGLAAFAAETKPQEHAAGNSVLVLGSLHGLMLEHPHYSVPVLVEAIIEFRPDVILTEVRPEQPGALEGSIDGGIEQAVIYAVAETQAYRLIPVDWFDDNFVAAMLAAENVSNPALDERQAPLREKYQKSIASGTFSDLQGAETQATVRAIYDLDERYGDGLSRQRNERICGNIRAQLDAIRGKRIAIIFGLDHKYYLEDCVRKHGDTLAESPVISERYRLPDRIRELALRNARDAKVLLQTRLTEGYYSGVVAQRLQEKVAAFDRWISALQRE